MARRDVAEATEERELTQEEIEALTAQAGADEGSFNADLRNDEADHQQGLLEMNTDFDLGNEYKPDPLMRAGTYNANVIGVTFEPEKSAIAWKLCMAENEGMVMSDGETPLDGNHFYFRNWLPKPGDENEMESNGRVTKRQGKINRLKEFADKMKINMGTPRDIANAIANSEWVGIQVKAVLAVKEYQGKISNEVKSIVLGE